MLQIVRGRRQSTRKIRVGQTWRTRNRFNLLKIPWRRFAIAFPVTDLVYNLRSLTSSEDKVADNDA